MQFRYNKNLTRQNNESASQPRNAATKSSIGVLPPPKRATLRKSQRGFFIGLTANCSVLSLFGASKNWWCRGATGYNLGTTVAPIPPAMDASMPRKTSPDGRRQLRIGTRTDNRRFSSQFTQPQLISDLSPITEFSRD